MTSKLLPSEGTEAGRLPRSSATPSSSRSSRRPPGNAGRSVDAASWGRPPCSPQQTQLATGHLLRGQKPTSHSPGDKGHGHRHLANRARATRAAPPAPASKATPAHSPGVSAQHSSSPLCLWLFPATQVGSSSRRGELSLLSQLAFFPARRHQQTLAPKNCARFIRRKISMVIVPFCIFFTPIFSNIIMFHISAELSFQHVFALRLIL